MTLAEIVMNYLQVLLGDNYNLVLFNNFARDYTNPVTESFNEQVLNQDDKRLGIFTLNPASFNVVPFVSYNSSYKLEIWYRIDDLKKDKNGVLLEVPENNVLDDLKTLEASLYGTITLDANYRAKMTYSEPMLSTNYDSTGEAKYGVATITGNINITDKGVYTSDRVIKIGITSGQTTTYYAINGIRNRQIKNDSNGETIQEQGSFKVSTNPESIAHSITFSFDEYTPDTANPAMQKLIDIAEGNDITTKYLPVQIYKGNTLKVSFNALVDVNIVSENGDTGLERIDVSLTRL